MAELRVVSTWTLVLATGLVVTLWTGARAQEISVEHEILAEGPADPWAKMLGDVDGDGRTDVAIGGREGPLLWYENPDWDRHFIVGGGYETVDGELGDVDGDGDLDVVMGGLYWYENPRPGTDTSWTTHQIAEHATHDVEVADLNGDARLDVVTRDQSAFGSDDGSEVHVWLQTGTNAWAHEALSCPSGEGIDVADLDEDGRPDLVIGGIWFENTSAGGTGIDWQSRRFGRFHPNASVAVADLNGDGRKDVALTPAELEDEFAAIVWFEAPPTRTDTAWTEHVVDPRVEAVYHSLAVADMDGNGRTDLITAEMHQSEDPDEVMIFFNGEHGAWTKQVLSTRGSHLLQVGDVDEDGDPDVMGANWSGEYQPIEIWWNRVREE